MLKLVVASENLVLRNYLNDYFKNKINIEVKYLFHSKKLLNHVYYNESDIIIVDINLDVFKKSDFSKTSRANFFLSLGPLGLIS